MWPRKCLHSAKILVMMILMIISIHAAAPPPEKAAPSAIELRRVVRTPNENSARKFHSQVTSNPDLNYLKVEPQDLQLNQGDLSAFSVFLAKPLNQDIWVRFKCSGSNQSCNTFDLASLEAGLLLRPTDNRVTVNLTVHTPGHDVIDLEIDSARSSGVNVSDEFAFVRVRVGHSTFLTILGSVFGWVYFLSWSISFWPQNISNFKRKSVVGLNFDYTILHFTGFLFYSIFNLLLFFSAVVQEEYEAKFPRSEIPVELNDVVYSLHAAAITSITWCQCMIYENGGQRLSVYGKLFQAAAWSVGGVLMVLSFVHVLSWLTFIYYFSYVKLVITAVKYLPQVVFNFRRKSTAGWSIYMIYLDITGGTMSMLQMLTIAYNYDDWKTLVGNLPKLGLSIASILYDIIFLLQHFVFYGDSHDTKTALSDSASTTEKGGKSAPGLSRTSTLKKAGDSQDALFSGSSSSSNSSNISDRSSLQSRTLSNASTGSTGGGQSLPPLPPPPPPPPPGFMVKSISGGNEKTTPEKDGKATTTTTTTISGHPTNLDLSSHLDAIHLRSSHTDAKQ